LRFLCSDSIAGGNAQNRTKSTSIAYFRTFIMENQAYSFNFVNLLKFLVRWYKHLLIITFIAGVLTVIVCKLIITPEYQSTVVFYPSTNNSISNALLPGITGKERDVLAFGAEEEAEQLLQLLKSEKLKWDIIGRFKLLEHYGLDPATKNVYTKLSKLFDANVSYRRTEYASLEIAVNDRDPQLAADMANSIGNMLDTVKMNIQREWAGKALMIVEEAYETKKKQIQLIQDSLKALASLGVYNFEEQSRGFAEKGATANPADVEALKKYGAIQFSYQERLKLESEALGELQTKYEKVKIDAEQFLPCKFVVNSAGRSEEKVYPRTIITTLAMMMATFFMCLLVLIAIDYFRKNNILALMKENG
jgi:hypothetical protein